MGRKFIDKILNEAVSSKFPLIHLENETFYHQTSSEVNANSILKNGFYTDIHGGQGRFTHGAYFLIHPNAHYGDVTIAASITGNFIDLTNDNIFADKWNELKSSVTWNNEAELSKKLRALYPEADGIVFAEKYMIVVWKNECISDIQIVNAI